MNESQINPPQPTPEEKPKRVWTKPELHHEDVEETMGKLNAFAQIVPPSTF